MVKTMWQIHNLMWLEEGFAYYEIKFECNSHEDTEYNAVVLNAINEW